MGKLSDTQLIVLSTATMREDGLAVAPNKMNKAATSKVGSSLVARKLMREVRSKTGMPVWREDQDGRPISLMITRAGRDAIGVNDAGVVDGAPAIRSKLVDKKVGAATQAVTNAQSCGSALPRAGSKQALVIGMLSSGTGATLDALVEATGWLPHTTRAALTGLRKRGFSIERSRTERDVSIYRIVAAAA